MPIPSPEKGEKTDDFLSRCIKSIADEYPTDQAYAICQKKIENRKMSKETEEIFVLSPRKSEKRGDYISRCSSHAKMKSQHPSMKERLNTCMHAYNSYYKYWSRLEEFGSEDHPDVKFEGCMSNYKAAGKDYKEAYSLCMSELIVEPVAMENMDTNIGDCVAKRIKEDPSLTREEARKRCAASVVVQPSGGSNPAVVGAPVAVAMADYPWDECIADQLAKGHDEESAAKICGSIKAQNQSAQFAACPPETQDIELNLKNRQKAIDEAHYGPQNPNEPNEDYWKAKADMFQGDVEAAKKSLCGNCAFFDQKKKTLDCIAKGIGGEDAWDTIKAGDLGVCQAFSFKCASQRTCDAWVSGGPIVD